MGTRRILDTGRLSYYHCISRVIEKRYIFDDKERENFRKLMRQQEAFSGVRVVAWTCLSNHFHLLVAVDPKAGTKVQRDIERLLSDDRAFLKRLSHLYDRAALEDLEKLLEAIREGRIETEAKDKQIAEIKRPFLDRMHDLSCFVGEIKQRIAQRYNLRNERKGPLWEERFRSVLVQGDPGLLTTVSAYIDLNCVRAGITKDPRDWRWCGYSEAAAAQCLAREGVYETLGESNRAGRDGPGWRRVHQRYRRILMSEGVQRRDEDGRIVRKGLAPDEIDAEEMRGYELPARDLLYQRIRYFTDGLALGSSAFVQEVFLKQKRVMGVKRTVGPRLPRLAELGDLRTLRDLRSRA